MPKIVIPVYFDYASTLCYVAWRIVGQLERELDFTALWKGVPISLRNYRTRPGMPLGTLELGKIRNVTAETGVEVEPPARWLDSGKALEGSELARVSSTKSSLGSDGDADGGRCCPRSVRSRDFDRKSFPDAPHQYCMAAYSRKTLCVRHSSAHSPFTFSFPRSKNWRNPRACLICPNTGSTTHLRVA